MKRKFSVTRTLLALVVLLPVHFAAAGEWSTVVNGKAFHLGSERNWNEENYGLGLEYQFRTRTAWKFVLMGNGFRDSEKNMSYMAGGGLHRNLFSSHRFNGLYVDVGLNAFMMSRKNVDNGRPFPGALPSMTVGNRHMGLNLTSLPKAAVEEMTSARTMDKNLRGILILQIKFNISNINVDAW